MIQTLIQIVSKCFKYNMKTHQIRMMIYDNHILPLHSKVATSDAVRLVKMSGEPRITKVSVS